VAKLLRDRECRVLLLEGKLGVGVHPLVELLGPPQVTPGPGAQGVDELRDRLWCGMGGGGGLGCRHPKTSFLQRSAFSRALLRCGTSDVAVLPGASGSPGCTSACWGRARCPRRA